MKSKAAVEALMTKKRTTTITEQHQTEKFTTNLKVSIDFCTYINYNITHTLIKSRRLDENNGTETQTWKVFSAH